jgi:threonine synthase
MTAYALRCRVCENVSAPGPAVPCERCDGPTDVTYDWDVLRAGLSAETIAGGPATLWRYAMLLPAAPRDPGAGAGWTPLVHAPRLSEALGIDLYLKLENENPTDSFKDRIAAVAVAAAVELGLETICCASGGNLGDAVAAEAAVAEIEAIVLSPFPAPLAKAFGANVVVVDGSHEQCRRLEHELAELFPWGFVDGNLRAYGIEGAKTVAFEIAEQLDWGLPDAVVCPAASGTLAAKLAQGFGELTDVGLVSGRSPALFAAQPEGCQPIASAWADDRTISRVQPLTDVSSLAVGNPSFGEFAIGAARASGGTIISVPEDEISGNLDLLEKLGGVQADSASGVAIGALTRAVREGRIAAGERVVLVVTGSAKPVRPEPGPFVEPIQPEVGPFLERLGLDR